MTPEKKTIRISSITALWLAFSKFLVWIFTGSMTVIASATDSLLDFFVSLANYFVLKKSEKKSDWKHNFWYWKIQWLWAFLQWSVIMLSGFTIVYLSIKKIINKQILTNIDWPVYVMIFSILVTFFLVIYMKKQLKLTNNLVVKSDLFHYKTDLLSNVWILFVLVLIKFTNLLFLDLMVSMLIALYIIWWSYKIIWEWYQMLLDRSLNKNQINQIKKIIENTSEKITSFHMLKTRKSWNDIFIEVHLVFDEKISLKDAHQIWDEVEKQIMQKIPNSHITIHFDPYNDLNEKS